MHTTRPRRCSTKKQEMATVQQNQQWVELQMNWLSCGQQLLYQHRLSLFEQRVADGYNRNLHQPVSRAPAAPEEKKGDVQICLARHCSYKRNWNTGNHSEASTIVPFRLNEKLFKTSRSTGVTRLGVREVRCLHPCLWFHIMFNTYMFVIWWKQLFFSYSFTMWFV